MQGIGDFRFARRPLGVIVLVGALVPVAAELFGVSSIDAAGLVVLVVAAHEQAHTRLGGS